MTLPDSWTKDDSVSCRHFFYSETGRKILEASRLNRPDLTGESLEASALSAKEAKGWEGHMNFLAQLSFVDRVANTETELEHIDVNAFSNRVPTPSE